MMIAPPPIDDVLEQAVPGTPYRLDLRKLLFPRPFPKQEKFVLEPHMPDGSDSFWQGWLGGRGSAKTWGLVRKLLALALLNRGTPETPIWGALCGRDLKENTAKFLPILFALLGEIRRRTGVDLTPRYNKGEGTLTFPWGSSVYLLSYEKTDSLNKIRGFTLGWALLDELEVASVDIDLVISAVQPAIRDPRAKHKCFGWVSSPNGLRGMTKKHVDAIARKDPTYFLVTSTTFDNPYLDPDEIKRRCRGMSRRQYASEYLGCVLTPTNVVFGEWDPAKHVIPYTWNPAERTVIAIDWGTSNAYIAACKTSARGHWVIAKERKEVDTSYQRFRVTVEAFIDEVVKLDNGRYPSFGASDGAVSSEVGWFASKYAKHFEFGCHVLRKDKEQGIDWGLALVSAQLEPIAGPPKLYVSSALSATTDPEQMGARGAFGAYTTEIIHGEKGEKINTGRPQSNSPASHPLDALRYALCTSRGIKELHGGSLPSFIDPQTF